MKNVATVLAVCLAAPAFAQQDLAQIEAPASTLEEILAENVQLPDTEQEVRVIAATVDPNTAAGWHTHPTPVYVYVVEGELTMEVEGKETRTIGAGEAVAEPLQSPMRVRNESDTPVRVVVFQISPADEAFLEQE